VDQESEFDAKTKEGLQKKKRVIVLLKNASLETVKTKKGYELACADTHASILKRIGKNAQAGDYRPDILHRCLLALLDSPLNKAGHLQVYIETCKNVLIEVNPKVRIPRTFRRFAGLMVQLLHKLKIRASNTSQILLRVIKNPVNDHLPPDAVKVCVCECVCV
jgi:rRNA small subunit pseudouridine methyltransferase Nep1